MQEHRGRVTLFRVIYSAASDIARVRSIHGKTIFSEKFDVDVRRGLIQGDIISPVLFILILALDQIM